MNHRSPKDLINIAPSVLREYQSKLLNDILVAWNTNVSVLAQSPTAAGKTRVAEALIGNVLDSTSQGQIFFAVHRLPLIDQTSKSFTEASIPHSFISSEYDYDSTARVFICTIQTLHKKLKLITDPILIIIDEAHLASGASYEKTINHCRSLGSKILGITATPRGRLNHLFDTLVLGPSIKQLINDGWLAIPSIYVPPKTAQLVEESRDSWTVTAGDYNPKVINQFYSDNSKLIYGDTIAHCLKLNPDNKPAVVFCQDIKHVYETVDMFNSNGLKAAGIDGSMSRSERLDLLNKFRSGEITYMVSCQLLLEGYDFQECFMGVWLRITKSIVVWLQGNGRLMRRLPGKDECIILDQVNNTAELGPSFIDRTWYIDGKQKSRMTLAGINLKLCTKCGNYIKNSLLICPHCGKVFKSKSKQFKVIYEELQKITIESAQQLITNQCQKILNKEKWKMLKTHSDFVQFATEKGWTNPEAWADKKLAEKQANDKVFFEGSREELIVMFSKRKDVKDPIKKADETLAKRAELKASGKSSAVNAVYESGTLDEVVAFVKANKPEITNPEAYAAGVLRKRLASVLENGTPEQIAAAEALVPKEDKFESMVRFAKSGKMQNDDGTPKVLSDEEAEKFARNVVRKQLKAELESGDPVRVRAAVEKLHVKNPEAYTATVLQGN